MMRLEQIAEHARRHRDEALPFDTGTAVDRSMPFLCPTLVPLSYTPTWADLSGPDRLRATQLSALATNEMIAWFEASLSATLDSLLRLSGRNALPAELATLLVGFVEDEARHQRMWWTLNRLAEPARYPTDAPSITRPSAAARGLLRLLARRPLRFPAVVWVMLILEEHGNEIARRCARSEAAGAIEPHFAAAYLAHVRDETRHVHLDLHLIDWLWSRAGPRTRAMNAWLVRRVLDGMLYRPRHAAMAVFDALAAERPRLRPLRRRVRGELDALRDVPAYRDMIFSPASSPIAWAKIERYPEVRAALAPVSGRCPPVTGSRA